MKRKIVSWLKKQVAESKAKGLIFGLSGGIDSSVIAAVSKEAAGPRKVLALAMPIHSQPQDLADAKLVAKVLKIKLKIIDLSGAYDCLIKILPKANKLAQANLKPRLRMLTLYYFANNLNYLVCGTGNKSELMVGYFTKYGDGAVDLLPIGSLYKKDVRNLARELNIPERIITKPPTAGLWPGQTDESEMGLLYEELDEILERMEKGAKQFALPGKVKKIKMMYKASMHKRNGPLVCFNNIQKAGRN